MNSKRMTSILQVLSFFLLIGLATNAQAATYSFKSFEGGPGVTDTEALSINASGQVVGVYYDASGRHGFVYSGGKFTSLDVPGAKETSATSINASGQVVGVYYDASGHYRGFVYSDGKFTSLDVPGAKETSATSINASGQVAGFYSDASGHYRGFVYSDGKFTSLDVPGAMDTYAYSINASGQVLLGGIYSASYAVCCQWFVYSDGKFTSIDAPGGTRIDARSINDSGQVAGFYWNNDDNSHGFVYSDGKFTSFDAPGSWRGTNALSINASGQVAGFSFDDSGRGHGFVYSDGKFTSLDPPGATGTNAYSINASGQVTGSYSDASGAGHGFIATPTTPFSAFNVRRLVVDQNRGALFLGSNFTLGKDSNGINPVREEVTLTIANATLTIPAGSFHENSHPSLFAFAGQIDNIWIEALIKPFGRNRFAFQALTYGAPIGDTKNPVTVELTIGDDSGTTTANASLQ